MRRGFGLVATLVVLVASSFTTTTAQPATPVFTADDGCTVEPRPIEFFERLIATPVAVEPTVEVTLEDLTAGPEADQEVAAAVEETVRELFACVIEGDPLRAYALYTDEWVARLYAITPIDGEVVASLATPQPIPPDDFPLFDVYRVHVLPDGRIGALVDRLDERSGQITTDLYIFREVDVRYLIDEIIPLGHFPH